MTCSGNLRDILSLHNIGFHFRSAAETIPQAPAASADLDRDCGGPDGAGSSKRNPSALPSQGRPTASGN